MRYSHSGRQGGGFDSPTPTLKNEWTNKSGRLNPGGGWFDWVRNDVDGRYCARGYNGDIQCYDALNNTLKTVYTDPRIQENRPEPRRGDLQVFVWNHVTKEYINMDGGRSVGVQPWAFSMLTHTWRPLTNADFAGIESRKKASGTGSATSPDHNLILVHVRSSRLFGLLDLKNQTYSEIEGPATMPLRSYTQNQLLYIGSLKKFLLFGGRGASEKLNDLWLFDPASKTWTSVPHQNPPSGRDLAQMAYDPVRNIVYLTGGFGTDDGRVSILHLSNWTWEHLPLPAGRPLVDYPGYRRVGAAIFDPSAGFCESGGVIEGGTWIQSANIWCFK